MTRPSDTEIRAMREQLRTALAVFIAPEHPEVNELIDLFEHQYTPRKEFFVREGEQEKYIYFLVRGAVKVSLVHNGDEKILDFWFDNNFFSSYSSLLTKTVSRVFIQALADTDVLRIEASVITQRYNTSLFTNKVGRLMAEQLFLRKTQREIDFLTKSATERYRDLLARAPEIVSRIPVHLIASYLGIRPESLSRIRRELFS